MDPITQGVLGAAAAQAVLARRLGPRAWWLGALGGMAADLDVLIRSSDDPLVAITYHRHFTHSLAFVPIGGLLCALPWILRRRNRDQRREIVAATTLGYATHGLLDAFTTYGTQLWWPFSSSRVAWDFVAIVDPIYTLLLALGVWAARRRASPRPAIAALIVSSMYLALGGILHARALAAARGLARERGHELARVDAFPMLPVNFLWRTVYRAGGRVHIDEVHTPWFGATWTRAGTSVASADDSQLAPDVAADPRTSAAFRTFTWFADGWVGRTQDPSVFADLRYATTTAGSEALWVIRLAPAAPHPVSLVTTRPQVRDALAERWRELTDGAK